MQVNLDSSVKKLGEIVILTTTLSFASQPVTGADVTDYVTLANGVQETVVYSETSPGMYIGNLNLTGTAGQIGNRIYATGTISGTSFAKDSFLVIDAQDSSKSLGTFQGYSFLDTNTDGNVDTLRLTQNVISSYDDGKPVTLQAVISGSVQTLDSMSMTPITGTNQANLDYTFTSLLAPATVKLIEMRLLDAQSILLQSIPMNVLITLPVGDPTATATPTSTQTTMATATHVATLTPTPTETSTSTPTETQLETETPTATATNTPNQTPSPTGINTNTVTPVSTDTPTPTATLPSATDTVTPTVTQPSPDPTATHTATPTPTNTPTPTGTSELPTPTATVTPTAKPTEEKELNYHVYIPLISK